MTAFADTPVRYDSYSPVGTQDVDVCLGSYMMSSGVHRLTFRAVGKNPASLGYSISIDTLTVSPCGVAREAEAQLPPSYQWGAVASNKYEGTGVCSAARALFFPATATGQTFTLNMENDRWEETNFRGEGALCHRTVVEFDESNSPRDFVVRLQGLGYAWQANLQTAASNVVHDATRALTNSTVRVLVRGRLLQPYGGNIAFPGNTVYAYFCASSYGALRVKSAFIAEAASQTNASFNAATTGTRLYFAYGATYSREEMLISAGSGCWATPAAPYEIDPDKSYVISFTVGTDYGCTVQWPETHAGVPGAYVIPGRSDSGTAMSADWSSLSPVTLTYLPAVYYLYTVYPTNGVFTSQVVDTKLQAPVFGDISWNAETPSNTSLKIKVRTGDDHTMTNAPAWDTVAAMTASGTVTATSRQFVQFQAILDPDSGGWYTPKLKDVTLRWVGATAPVTLFGTFVKGPNGGLYEVSVDERAPATAIGVPVITNGSLAGVTIVDGGSGYTSIPLVRIIGGGGTGAVAVAFVTNGVVTSIDITDAGNGYTGTPVVVVSPPFIEQPLANAINLLSLLTSTNLDTGTNYQLQALQSAGWTNIDAAFTATCSTYSAYCDHGAPNTFRLVVTPVPEQASAIAQVVDGSITGVSVITGGWGYVTNPAVTFVGRSGSNATARSTIAGGSVSAIDVIDAGSGYTNGATVLIEEPPMSASFPDVTPVMKVSLDRLSPYDRYRLESVRHVGDTWSSCDGSLLPTSVTDTLYIVLTNAQGFYRVTYDP